MVQTDVTVAAAVHNRLSHIGALDWEIRTVETADPILAQEQADVLRYAYDRIENLTEAATKLAYGLFTGYTLLEKIRTGYSKLIKRLDYMKRGTGISTTRPIAGCSTRTPGPARCAGKWPTRNG